MKRGRLYLKIFFSFLLILIVTEIIIFGLFLYVLAGNFRNRFRSYVEAHAYMLKELIEERVGRSSFESLADNVSIKELIDTLSGFYNAEIWIEDQNEKILVSSFEEKAPLLPVREKLRRRRWYSHREQRMPHPFYIQIPFTLTEGETGFIHVLSVRPERKVFARPFALGLIAIGLLIAVLLLPVSRFITRPLVNLRQSVIKISEGDLTQRAKVKTKDEIGELVKAFNSMADRIERMVNGTKMLTANISHELRSPLARIQVAVELLIESLKSRDGEEYKKYIGPVSEEIEVMDKLIGQIVKLSKLDIRSEGVREEFDVIKVLREIIQRFKPWIEKKSINLKFNSSTVTSTLIGNRDDIQTALSNLVDNAVKFTPENGTIDFKIHREEKCVEIAIVNSTESSLNIDMERIFEPFYRLRGTHFTGSGLGLAIVKKIVENHEGRLNALQKEGLFEIKIWLETVKESCK